MADSDTFSITQDPALIPVDKVHRFLAGAYWSEGIPRSTVERSMRHSLLFGVLRHMDFEGDGSGELVGFARVVSDHAVVAYIADVYVDAPYRGRGLSKLLMRAIMDHPELQGLRRWMLATRDAHGLYTQFGFKPLSAPDRLMEIVRPDIYRATLVSPPVEAESV